MKKHVWSMAALALLLTTASCTDEQMAGGSSDGERMVTFTAQLPQGLQTRAIGDGLTATTLSYAVYETGTTTPLIESEDEVTFTDGKATLSLRLASGKSYDFLFWADAYGKDDTDNPYTVDFATQTLSVNYNDILSNDEKHDAFFGTETVEVTGAVNKEIILKRPFAQLNIGTNDMAEAQTGGLNTTGLQTSVKVGNIYKNLNLMNGEVGEDTEVTFGLNDIPDATFTANGRTFDYLALNYLLVGTDKALVNCEFTYNDGKLNHTITADNVPVQRNYRTNIFGSLLTGSVDFDITIDPNFAETDHNYAELLLAAQNGGKVTLTDDVTLTDEMPIIIENGVTMEVELNGKTITREGADNGQSGVFTFRVNDGTLILNDSQGTGVINGGSGLEHSSIAAMSEDAQIIINGGNYKVGGNPSGNNYNVCVYAMARGKVTINGGTFENEEPQTGTTIYPALNVNNSNPGTITVYGGTFINYDPATGDDSSSPETFVADGYSSVKVSAEGAEKTEYVVVKGAGAASANDITTALTEGKELITLAADVTLENALTLSSTNSVIDLNEHTLTIKGNNYVSVSGNLSFENGKIVAEGMTDPAKALFSVGKNSSFSLDGVTLTTSATGIIANISSSDIAITVKNSIIDCYAYCVGTNATTPVGENVKIILENSTFTAVSPIFITIPCEATINNCNINGNTHGMILRGGTATVSNSLILLDYSDTDYENHNNQYENGDWGSGNAIYSAALTIGNKSTGYQYPSVLKLENTKVISTKPDYLPALYSYANQGDGLGVTITYDDETTFTGGIVYGSENITVNGEPAPVTGQP